MAETVVNIHAAKTQLSQLVARAEKGEHITIARAGKPVAQLGPAPRAKRSKLPADDPLLNLDKFAVDGPGGQLTNADIDRIHSFTDATSFVVMRELKTTEALKTDGHFAEAGFRPLFPVG